MPTIDDWNKDFSGCVVLARYRIEDGTQITPTPVTVLNVLTSRNKGAPRADVQELDEQRERRSVTDLEIVQSFPETGMYNTSRGCVYVQRTQLKQWRKGMTNKNVSILSVPGRKRKFPEDVGRFVYRQDSAGNVENSIEEVKSGSKVARALSNDVAIATMNGVAVPAIFYRNNLVGWYDECIRLAPFAEHLYEAMSEITDCRVEN